jgi:hypothetical protein
MTVRDQGLSGADDDSICRVVGAEGRVFITLDRDFGEVLRFPPEATAGIVVLAASGRLSKSIIQSRIADLLAVLDTEPLNGSLWIVEPGRIRVHQKRN